jgi:hypothetical protein
MRKKILLFLPLVLLSFLAICFAGAFPKSVLLHPQAGASFKPGDNVTIRWKIVDADKAVFCEQEIYLLVGNTKYQISPELQKDKRKYNWIVPNIPAEKAMLELHLGCERGSAFEASYIQTKHPFSIREQ